MKMKSLIMPVVAIGLSALILLGASMGLSASAKANQQQARYDLMCSLLPGNTSFEEEVYEGEDDAIRAVYKGENGYVIETSTYGYAGDVVMLIGVDNSGCVTGLTVLDLAETYGLGARALSDMDFMGQFVGTAGEAEIGTTVDAMTGATVTSKAITKGVNAASAYVAGADTSSGATEWGG